MPQFERVAQREAAAELARWETKVQRRVAGVFAKLDMQLPGFDSLGCLQTIANTRRLALRWDETPMPGSPPDRLELSVVLTGAGAGAGGDGDGDETLATGYCFRDSGDGGGEKAALRECRKDTAEVALASVRRGKAGAWFTEAAVAEAVAEAEAKVAEAAAGLVADGVTPPPAPPPPSPPPLAPSSSAPESVEGARAEASPPLPPSGVASKREDSRAEASETSR